MDSETKPEVKEPVSAASSTAASKKMTPEDFKKLTSAQQAKILRKSNPEALAKIDKEIEERTAKFRKIMQFLTYIICGVFIYVFFIR
jgi:hypothetical protein